MSSIQTNGHLAWFAGPSSAISDAHWASGPTKAELDTLDNYSPGVKVDGTDFGLEASEQVSDRSFADLAGSQARGVSQASGSIEVYTPGTGDTTSIIAQTYDAFGSPRTELAVAQRPVADQANAIAAGDEVNIFKVLTDDRQHNRNDASRTLGVGLVLQGALFVNYIVPSAVATAPTAAPQNSVSLTTGFTVGEVAFLEVAYEGRNITAGAKYVSSNENIVRVTPGGAVLAVGAGSATITVSYPGAAALTPISVTVTAP